MGWCRRPALEGCISWVGRVLLEPTAFAILPYLVLTVALKYVYLMTYLNCRGFSLLRGTLWVLLTWLKMGKAKGSGCAASSSSQHLDQLISAGAGATGVPCGDAAMARTAYFTYTASNNLVRNRKRREIVGFFIWKGLCFPLHLIVPPYYVKALGNMTNTARLAHRFLKR